MSQQESPPKTSLADLRPMECAHVDRVVGQGPWSDRLRELGFTPGTQVTLLRRAPFGGPLLFGFRGYQLCLRPSEASKILLRS
ncbi:MAG: ferrous iron transport protein A [Planctomycetes bacterium]|nr:ferrous iron transport protein A [Planctomycetota bacterium]